MDLGTAYWPEETEPSFVSHQDGEDGTWIPLCECGREMERLARNPWANWECTNYDHHGRLVMALIWADDFPDYYEDEEED